LYLAPRDFSLLLAFWLGVPLPPLVFSGDDPYHAGAVFRRSEEGTATRAHEAVCKELELLLRSARVLHTREDRSFFLAAPHPEDRDLRPDFTLEDHDWGVTWVVDVVVAGAQGARGRVDTPGGSAAASEARKDRKYARALSTAPAAVLAPVGLESFGGVGVGARRFLRRVAELSCGERRAGYAPQQAHYYAQRLVVALVRAQSQALRRWARTAARTLRDDWHDPDFGSDVHRVTRPSAGGSRSLSVSDLVGVSMVGAAPV
jgi:hypothetical protein